MHKVQWQGFVEQVSQLSRRQRPDRADGTGQPAKPGLRRHAS